MIYQNWSVVVQTYIKWLIKLLIYSISQLLQLCEAESVSYLDEVATNPNSRRLGQTLALEVSSTGADHCPGIYSSVSAAT